MEKEFDWDKEEGFNPNIYDCVRCKGNPYQECNGQCRKNAPIERKKTHLSKEIAKTTERLALLTAEYNRLCSGVEKREKEINPEKLEEIKEPTKKQSRLDKFLEYCKHSLFDYNSH